MYYALLTYKTHVKDYIFKNKFDKFLILCILPEKYDKN